MDLLVVGYVIGTALLIEGALMLIPLVFAVFIGESIVPFAAAIGACLLIGFPLYKAKPGVSNLLSKEGVVSTALVWIILSLTGMLPFIVSGSITNPVDAFFETVSGSTTTGSTILTEVESLPKSILLWRSLMHWIGGMGILVFMLALIPLSGGTQMNLMKAESPGPSISKLVPRAQDTAKILYGIYFAMTVASILVFKVLGMSLFDAVCIGLGAAGTGGFSVLNDSCASYTVLQQAAITVFVALFGVNFNFYFLLLFKRDRKSAFKSEEIRCYFAIMLSSVILITASLMLNGTYSNVFRAFHDSAFHAASIMTTTGYATADLNDWPAFAKSVIIMLMLVGACAGSTGGGLKVSRAMLIFKSFVRECRKILHPQQVIRAHMDGKTVDESVIHSSGTYFFIYVLLMFVSVMLVSINGLGWDATISAVIATFNNIGPGFGLVGSMGNFSELSIFSKLVLSADMLIGRLEIFPIMLLFSSRTWHKF